MPMTDIFLLYIAMLVARDKTQDFLGINICIYIYINFLVYGTHFLWRSLSIDQLLKQR